jgi:hypothetical protein
MLPPLFLLAFRYSICYSVSVLGQTRCGYHSMPYELGRRWYPHLGRMKQKGYFQGTPCASLGE